MNDADNYEMDDIENSCDVVTRMYIICKSQTNQPRIQLDNRSVLISIIAYLASYVCAVLA